MPLTIVSSPDTLDPLPHELRRGLTAVTVLATLSLIAASGLFFMLGFRILYQWLRKDSTKKTKHTNQFIWLIFNLLFADIQQACAFIINGQWLAKNAIEVGTNACWMQGWFVSTGDLSSGVWCTAIGLHTFAGVIFKYQLPMKWFYATIILLWTFIYAVSFIGVGMYTDDIFVRAGAWCWVNKKYSDIRLFTHYLWIFIAEFGNVMLYAIIFCVLRVRIAQGYYGSVEGANQARLVAKVMVVYPLVYVMCTLPLASLRMASQTTSPGFEWFCAAGAMITSNGFLDVCIYSMTRRLSVFEDEEEEVLDSFQLAWQRGGGSNLGTTTHIVGGDASRAEQGLAPIKQTSPVTKIAAKVCSSILNAGRKPQPRKPSVITMHHRPRTLSTDDLVSQSSSSPKSVYRSKQDWLTGQKTVAFAVERDANNGSEPSSVGTNPPILEAVDSFDRLDDDSLGSSPDTWKEHMK